MHGLKGNFCYDHFFRKSHAPLYIKVFDGKYKNIPLMGGKERQESNLDNRYITLVLIPEVNKKNVVLAIQIPNKVEPAFCQSQDFSINWALF